MEDQFNQLLQRLWPVIAPIYQFTEEGVAEARNLFQSKKRPFDPWYFSHTVRFHVVGRLDQLKGSAISYTTIEQAMSGIEIDFSSIKLKLFKATQGKLPAPGKSESRQAFYNRNLFGSDADVFFPKSLAILWDIDAAYTVTLQLVCPLAGAKPWEPGQQRWAFTIPHPASIVGESPKFQPPVVEDIPDFERTDDNEQEDTGTDQA